MSNRKKGVSQTTIPISFDGQDMIDTGYDMELDKVEI
jgi:hypothetical protein